MCITPPLNCSQSPAGKKGKSSPAKGKGAAPPVPPPETTQTAGEIQCVYISQCTLHDFSICLFCTNNVCIILFMDMMFFSVYSTNTVS